jgi:hypothetical protein
MIVAVIGVGLVNVPRETLVAAGPRLWRQLRGAVANLIP